MITPALWLASALAGQAALDDVERPPTAPSTEVKSPAEPAPAAADPTLPIADDETRWTPDEAVARALQTSPDIEAARHRVDEDAAAGGLGLLLENPEARIGPFRTDRVFAPLVGPASQFPLEGTRALVRWSPPGPSRFGPAQLEVHHREQRRRIETAWVEREVAAEVRRLHAEARNLARLKAVAEQRVALAEQELALARARVEAQVLPQVDVTLAEIEVRRRKAAALDLAARERERAHLLRMHLGLGADEPVLLADASDGCHAAAPLEASGEALEARALLLQAKEADAAALAAWVGLIPWPKWVQLAYELGPTRTQDHLQLTVAFPLTVLNFNQNEISAQRARRARLEAEARAATVRAQAAREVAAERARTASTQLEQATGRDRAHLDQARTELAALLEAGQVTPEARLKVEDQLLDATERQLELVATCEEAAIELLRLAPAAD